MTKAVIGFVILVAYVQLLLFIYSKMSHFVEALEISVGPHATIAIASYFSTISTLLVFNTIFAILYILQVPSVEAHRVLSAPWPWEKSYSAEARKRFWNSVTDSFQMTAVNTTLIALPLSYFTASGALAANPAMLAREAAPDSALSCVALCACFALVDDIVFYFAHRAFHTPSLYFLHKPHHVYTHTVSCAVLHLHPVEFTVANLLPVALGPMIMSAHLATALIWYHLRLVQTIEAHSNYAFPYSPFVALGVNGNGAAHEAHHSINTGNFGSFTTVWDHLFGTAIKPDTMAAAFAKRK